MEIVYPDPYEFTIKTDTLSLKVFKVKGKYMANVEVVGSPYDTISVPFKFFADTYTYRLKDNAHYCETLDEVTRITQQGVVWKIEQNWSEESYLAEVPHMDMIKIMKVCQKHEERQHCHNTQNKSKKVKLKSLFWLPLKLMKGYL